MSLQNDNLRDGYSFTLLSPFIKLKKAVPTASPKILRISFKRPAPCCPSLLHSTLPLSTAYREPALLLCVWGGGASPPQRPAVWLQRQARADSPLQAAGATHSNKLLTGYCVLAGNLLQNTADLFGVAALPVLRVASFLTNPSVTDQT